MTPPSQTQGDRVSLFVWHAPLEVMITGAWPFYPPSQLSQKHLSRYSSQKKKHRDPILKPPRTEPHPLSRPHSRNVEFGLAGMRPTACHQTGDESHLVCSSLLTWKPREWTAPKWGHVYLSNQPPLPIYHKSVLGLHVTRETLQLMCLSQICQENGRGSQTCGLH